MLKSLNQLGGTVNLKLCTKTWRAVWPPPTLSLSVLLDDEGEMNNLQKQHRVET